MRDFVKEYSSVAKLDVLEGLGINPKTGAITAAAKAKLTELWKDISDEDRAPFYVRNRFNARVKTGPRKRRIGGQIAEDTTERETRAYSTLVRWRGCFQRRKASLQAAIQECAGIEGTVTDRASAVWDALSVEERLEI